MREALVDARQRLSWSQYHRRVERLAARWLRLGLTRDDVIAIQLPNWNEFAVAVNAAMMLGIPFCQFHSDFRRKEVEFILRFIGASLLVMPHRFRGFDHLALIRELKPALPRLEHLAVVADEASPEDTFDLRRFLDNDAEPEVSEAELKRHRPGGNDLARVLFTSGTTGDPKAVMHTHNSTDCSARFHNRAYGITAKSVFLVFLPVGLNWGFVKTLQAIRGLQARLQDIFRRGGGVGADPAREGHAFRLRPPRLVALLNAPNFGTTARLDRDGDDRWRVLPDRGDPSVAPEGARPFARALRHARGGRPVQHAA